MQNTPEATQPLPLHIPKASTPTLNVERYVLRHAEETLLQEYSLQIFP